MTPAQRSCSQMPLSTLRARPCASAPSCATDSTVRRSLAPRATDADLCSRSDPHSPPLSLRVATQPVPLERRPPIQSP